MPNFESKEVGGRDWMDVLAISKKAWISGPGETECCDVLNEVIARSIQHLLLESLSLSNVSLSGLAKDTL